MHPIDEYSDFDHEETYGAYAEEYDPDYRDYMKLVRKPPDPKFKPKVPEYERHWHKIEEEKRRSIVGDFETTYKPGHVEHRILMGTLQPFFEAEFIDDILGKVKGGKEAEVYRCSITNEGQRTLYAAKLYRPRSHRTMKNDGIYREGRGVLGQHGESFRVNDRRVLRAMLNRSDYGKQVEQTSWLMHEFHTLQDLHAAGGDVPEPIECAPNAILMEFIGDERVAAPVLHDMRLETGEVKVLFEQVVHNLELMLREGLIHGDLSAHNILYWQGRLVLIDFPQVVPVTANKQAYGLLERDVTRVCQYWRKQGLASDPEALTRKLWGTYSPVRHEDILADLSAALVHEPTAEDPEDEYPGDGTE